MTSNQIITLARKKLLETTDDIISDETILLYLNEANQDIKIRVFPNVSIKTATISFTNGVGTLPSDFGTLYGDPFQNAHNIFPEVSIQDFMRESQPNMVTIESGTIKVFPIDTATVTIKYYPIYETLDTVQNPTIPAFFHELLIYGILFRAFEDLQDEALSKYYFDKFEALLEAKAGHYSNYEEGNQRGGQMFNEISIVSDGSSGFNPNQF